MPFTVVSATTRADLLSAIATFATSYGWTIEYNVTGELAMTNSNCHVALSDGGVTARTDSINGGTVNDGIIHGAIAESITTSNHHFYGHPGSIVTTSNDSDRIISNDLTGPFSNVYLFTDTAHTYLHCVTQSSSDRYSLMSFGNLNKLGMSHADVGYAFGEFYTWWPNNSSVINSLFAPNDISSPYHYIGMFLETYSSHVYFPSGVIDTSLGFPSGSQQVSGSSLKNVFNRSQAAMSGYTQGYLLDHYHFIDNDTTTGGAPLWPIPIRFSYNSGAISCHLGIFPDIFLFNMSGFAPKATITYGSETYQIFPLKAQGSYANSKLGSSPTQYSNTQNFAIAIKQIT
jgi:hypothetical protein